MELTPNIPDCQYSLNLYLKGSFFESLPLELFDSFEFLCTLILDLVS